MATSEIIASRSHQGTLGKQDYSVTYEYVTLGTADDAVVRAEVLAAAPATITVGGTTLYRDAITIRPEHVDTVVSDVGCWFSSVTYITKDAADVKDSGWEASATIAKRIQDQVTVVEQRPYILRTHTTAPTPVRRLYSLHTRRKFPEDAPDFQGAIELAARDGELLQPQGVDVYVGAESFTMTVRIPDDVYFGMRPTWSRYKNHVINGEFEGYDVYEVLFMGIDAQQAFEVQGEVIVLYWDVTFNFAVSSSGVPQRAPGVPLVGLPDGVVLESKQGWEYMWIYRMTSGTATTPVGVYYEQVYPTAELARFGFPEDGGAPEVSLDPVNQTLVAGDQLLIVAAFTGAGPMIFQWYKGSTKLTGQTSPSLWIDSCTESDAGTYTCKAVNVYGSDETSGAFIAINPAP